MQNERIVDIKEDSVNKQLSRVEEALGIREKYKNACTGIHSIRKMVAQREYDRCRNGGMARKQAMEWVSAYLGHSRTVLIILVFQNITNYCGAFLNR